MKTIHVVIIPRAMSVQYIHCVHACITCVCIELGVHDVQLAGIKGQYLIFEDSTVFNIRGNEGFRVEIDIE